MKSSVIQLIITLLILGVLIALILLKFQEVKECERSGGISLRGTTQTYCADKGALR